MKINMLNSEHPDGYFVINEKIKNSIIDRYAKDNELYAIKGRRIFEDDDEFEYEGEIYRYWENVDKWTEIRNEFKTIDDSYKGVSPKEALQITINGLKDTIDKNN